MSLLPLCILQHRIHVISVHLGWLRTIRAIGVRVITLRYKLNIFFVWFLSVYFILFYFLSDLINYIFMSICGFSLIPKIWAYSRKNLLYWLRQIVIYHHSRCRALSGLFIKGRPCRLLLTLKSLLGPSCLKNQVYALLENLSGINKQSGKKMISH